MAEHAHANEAASNSDYVVEQAENNSYDSENNVGQEIDISKTLKHPTLAKTSLSTPIQQINRKFNSGGLKPANVLALQRTIGNQAVRRLLKKSNLPKHSQSVQPTIQRFAVGEDLNVTIAKVDDWQPTPLRKEVAPALREVGLPETLCEQFYDAATNKSIVDSQDKTKAIFAAVKILLDNNAQIAVFANGEPMKKAVMDLFNDGRQGQFKTTPASLENFAREVLQRSGWFEGALSKKAGKLSDSFNKKELENITAHYKRDEDKKDDSQEPLDEKLLRDELPSNLISLLKKYDPEGAETIDKPVNSTLREKADLIRDTALEFYAPYAQTARTVFSLNFFHESAEVGQGWKYSDNLSDLQLEDNYTKNHCMNYLRNRAAYSEVGVFEKAHFSSKRHEDAVILDEILEKLLENSDIVALVDRHLKTSSFTDANNKVHLNTKRQKKGEGNKAHSNAEWSEIYTLCHELMHVMVHSKFENASKDIENGQIVKEGFVELLGFKLYNYILGKAENNNNFKEVFMNGLTDAPLPEAQPREQMSYGEASQKAAAIMDSVGEKRVITAFFLGKPHLVGIGNDI